MLSVVSCIQYCTILAESTYTAPNCVQRLARWRTVALNDMETKDGAVVFLVLLSVALFTTLAYCVWHNGSEIAQLQAELQKVKESVGQKESTSQSAASHLPADEGLGMAELPAMENVNLIHQLRTNEHVGGSAIHKLAAALSELKRSRRNAEPPATVQLLTDALSEIVGGELEALLNCDTDDNGTKCTIEPGPKGDRGPIGQRGEKGDTGEQGRIGPRGEKGEKGNHGYAGYKGEFGPKGNIGERGLTGSRGEKGEKGHHGHKGDSGSQGVRGPVGPSGEKGGKGELGYTGYKGEKGQTGSIGSQGGVGPKGAVGPRGPVATLAQSGCNWQYTDTCGHHCGTNIRKRTTCPVGQYVAGFGIITWDQYGRFNTHILCCPVH